jgi:hypothetical protein
MAEASPRGHRVLTRLAHRTQRILLTASYWWYRLLDPRSQRDSIDWVVGPHEVASMVKFITRATPNSFSVLLHTNRYYPAADYDKTLPDGLGRVRIALAGPVILGRLMNRARGFVYVGGSYLSSPDGCRAEFAFLARHGRRLVCYWTGTDIRSPALMRELERETGRPNIVSYFHELAPSMAGEAYEEKKKRLAAVADRYADAMFLHPHANRNYLTRPVEPFLYLFPDERFQEVSGKFDEMDTPILVHASSSPIIKGTQLVRAAVARLDAEGYRFDYRELIGVDNDTVVDTLRQAHISIGHFYGFTPGIYGIESLALQCALVTSADERREPYLPAGCNEAWYVTDHHEVYQHLKDLLDEPERTRDLALRGHAYAKSRFSASANGPDLRRVLDTVLAGSHRAG